MIIKTLLMFLCSLLKLLLDFLLFSEEKKAHSAAVDEY